MVTFYDEIPEFVLAWIPAQHIFFVATAPLAQTGTVNVSPKCTRGTFHVLSPTLVWYEDLSGSGSETIAHLRENGRITLMLVALSGAPRILRLFGTGVVHEVGTPEYTQFVAPGTRTPGSRAAIVVSVHRVSSSCGFSIPRFALASERDLLLRFAQAKEATGAMRTYWALKNAASIDGLPALTPATWETTDVVPESAPDRRVATARDDEELYAAAKAAALAEKEPLEYGPAVSASGQETSRVGDRDQKMLVVGFVAGLVAAALMDRLAARLR